MDIGLQDKIKSINSKLPSFIFLRMKGGSGFRMARLLRDFFFEYAHRIATHGPHTLPSSFNIVEGFLEFNDDLMVFDLRQESEHLLRLHDYFDWYTSGKSVSGDPELLVEVMQEGVIYSFDLAGDTGEYAISSGGSRLAIAGVSMIRHETELSVIILAGENPPHPSDITLAKRDPQDSRPIKRRESLSPNPDLSIQDRYLEGMEGFGRVLLLTRINLRSRRHDVRYINLDVGEAFSIITDDVEMLSSGIGREMGPDEMQSLIDQLEHELKRYDQLFSALTSLVYLPILFIAEPMMVVESRFATELGSSKQGRAVRKSIKVFGRDALITHRIIRCLTSESTDNLALARQQVVEPPDFTFETTGFWKPLGPTEIGEDRHGNPTVARTWVERTESFSARSLESFVMRNQPRVAPGEDPGVIYIVRSPSHSVDIYKVGLTRRSAQERAAELGYSTGVPLPFEVIASWEVPNCGAVERAAHTRLKKYRVHKRREFFRTSPATIVAAVQWAIAQAEGNSLDATTT